MYHSNILVAFLKVGEGIQNSLRFLYIYKLIIIQFFVLVSDNLIIMIKREFFRVWLTFRVHLDTAENWKLKLKTKKHCSEIIFKCVNNTVGPICNKKVAEKWNLWVHEQYTMCTDWSKKIWKVKVRGYCSLNSAWTVAATHKKLKTREKKKPNKTQTQKFSSQSKRNLSIFFFNRRCYFVLNTQ